MSRQEDAEVVRRLKAAGAIVLAKTNTPEFATGANTVNALFGATRNPWNPELSPAGSSGGSAVAVATGMLPLAQGTDFGCSIRIPAAFCGIVGIRPTPGLTPNYPMPLAWDSGQVHGPLARTAEDAAHDARRDGRASAACRRSRSRRRGRARSRRSNEPTDAKGLRIAYASDIAGHRRGFRDRRDLPPGRRGACAMPAQRSSRSSFDVSDGRDPYQTWRGAWMVGQQFARLSMLAQFGANLKGNIEGGPEGHRARSRQGRADAAAGVPSLPRTVRPLSTF